MEQYRGEPGRLELCWNTRTFLPDVPEEDDRPTVREVLDGRDFAAGGAVRQYWSVPERLLDLRWLTERPETPEATAQYRQAEHTLCRIVATLAAWSGCVWRDTERLRRDWAGDAAWNRLRERYEPLLRRCAARRRNGATREFSESELLRLYQLLRELPPLPASVRRGRPFRNAALRLRKDLEGTFGLALEREKSLRLFTGEDLQRNAEAATDFCEKALEFLEGALWRRELSAAKRLEKLSACLDRAAPDLPLAGGDIWSEVYHNALWLRLQAVADGVCRQINGGPEEPPCTVETLLERVEAVWQTLKSGSPVKLSLREYAADGSRCAALLETDGGTRIVAFSGFLDCEDPQTRDLLLPPTHSGSAAGAFQRIAAGLGAELAVHTPSVVDRMARCGVDRNCRLTAAATLRQELDAGVTDQKQRNFLKRSYGCCERKILAHGAQQGMAAPGQAVLHVKFAPCMNCYAALRQWADEDGIRLTLDCPELA